MRIFSSFRQLPERGLEALGRFPIVLLAGGFLAWVIAGERFSGGGAPQRLAIVALMGIIVAFDATMLKERLRLHSVVGQIGVAIVTAATLALIWWSIDLIATVHGSMPPYDTFVAEDEPIRIAAIGVALHALAAVLPFVGRRRLAAFWDYNRVLFIRVLSSALFSGVLYAGLAVALWAIDELLTIDVDSDTFLTLFGVMLGVVNTWFFLAGVPRVGSDGDVTFDSSALNPTTRTASEDALGDPITSAAPAAAGEAGIDDVHDADYPRGLKVFVQFVLLPLTAVYLVILYLYVARITIEWQLPDGQVSYLIFSYAVMGMLAYLLIYPLRDDDDNRWIRGYARGFFMALAPLLIVLVVALMRRTSDYGITEMRYYGVALAAWLALIVGYFLTRREDIRVIPTSLAVAALLSSVGPWSATPVSVRSQIAQLERRSGLDSARLGGDNSVANGVRSITQYLYERGRLAEAAANRTSRPDTVDTAEELTQLYGVDPGWQMSARQGLHMSFVQPTIVDVQGYSDVITIENAGIASQHLSTSLGSVDISMLRPGRLLIRAGTDSVLVPLHSIADSLARADAGAAPADKPAYREGPRQRFEGSAPPDIERASPRGLRARLVLSWMSGHRLGDSTTEITDAHGLLLIGGAPSRHVPTALDTLRRP